MGCSVIAKCGCGYESKLLMIGGGMFSFGEECLFPAYCSEGDHLVTINMLDHPHQCPDGHAKEPTQYNHPSLSGTKGNFEVTSWNIGGEKFTLTDGRYFCPACHQPTMEFSEGGLMWD